MTLDQAILEYKKTFGENIYKKDKYFIDIDIDAYMSRLSNRVKKVYDIYPDIFSNKRVLDIGASIGDQSFILNAAGNTVTSFDINPAIIDLLRKNTPKDVTVESNISNIKNKSFDTIFCSAVINLQAQPYKWFESLFDLEFETLVLIYNDGYTIPNHKSPKMYSPDKLGETTSLVEKDLLLEVCKKLNLRVINSELSWKEDVAINNIKYTQTALIVKKI